MEIIKKFGIVLLIWFVGCILALLWWGEWSTVYCDNVPPSYKADKLWVGIYITLLALFNFSCWLFLLLILRLVIIYVPYAVNLVL